MGNVSSSNVNGKIYVKTDKPYYIAGDQVTGHVFMDISNDFQSDKLNLILKGSEKCQWREELSNNDNTQQQYRYHYGKKIFYKNKITLYQFQQQIISKGQYSFPFSFLLQADLPGSYSEKNIEYEASIKYKIKAECNPSSLMEQKIKHTQELVIREPIKNMIEQKEGEKTQQIVTWCCLKQGDSYIKCNFDRNCYQSGECSQIICEIDNSKCQLDIKKVNFTFGCTLTLNSNQRKQKQFRKIISQNSLPGVKAGELAINDSKLITNLHLQKEGNPIQPSTKGQYIQCEYYLTVKSIINGFTCCCGEPQITIPISIVSPPPLYYGQVEIPHNWQPIQYAVKNIQFDNSTQYNYPKETEEYQENKNQNKEQYNENYNYQKIPNSKYNEEITRGPY